MRFLALALVLAAPAALAQHDHLHSHGDVHHAHPHGASHHAGGATWTIPTTPAARAAERVQIERRMAALDGEIASLTGRIDRVRADLSGMSGTSGEHARFDAALADYDLAFDAHRAESARVRATYEHLRRHRGSAAQRRAYRQAVYWLEDDAERLAGEAAMMREWAGEIDRSSRSWADDLRTNAQLGRSLSMQRLDLRHERWVLRQRRDLIVARDHGLPYGMYSHSAYDYSGHSR